MVNIGVSTIKGTTVAKTSFAFDTLRMDDNVEEVFLQLLEKQIKKLLGSKKVAAKKIFSCGIAMVGRKSFYDHYRLAMPPVLKNRAQIKDFVENTFKLDVYLENNVRALAMAESLFFPTEGSNSFMFVKIGPGLGSALVFSDELYRGVHGQAGEIGRSIVTGFYSQFQESQTVTLEEIISLDFIKEELKPYWNEFQLPYLFERVQGDRERLTMPEIYQALEYKEILIETLFRKKMRILAHRLYDYKNLLDLEEIYLFFSTNASKILSEYLITEMKQISNSLPTVTKISSLTTTASYLSGSAVAYIGHMENINELY